MTLAVKAWMAAKRIRVHLLGDAFKFEILDRTDNDSRIICFDFDDLFFLPRVKLSRADLLVT